MAEFISLDSGIVSQGVIKFLKVDNKMVSAAQLALVYLLLYLLLICRHSVGAPFNVSQA